MKSFAPLALAALLVASASAQSTFTDPANLRGERVAPRTGRELLIDQSEALGGRGLEQLLRKLNTRASLMLIVAHPDDEDGGMLTYYSRGMGARVADLSLNRGEGGQNLMTGDFEDALGLLRTQELLSADRYFDADQFFGTEVDFGFSKTKEESFAKWTHERVLYDVVRAIRIYRPLVIASVFIGGVTDGHGHHQVAGQITQEAFKAAGDPNVFPELAREGILPWQPLKVYARVPMQAITPQGLFDYATGRYEPAKFTNYVTGEVTTATPSVDVTVHEGKIDPILGPHRAVEDFVSYVQFARQGLGLQKSQIGAGMRIPPPGAFDVNYHRYGSMLPPSRQKLTEDSFFDGIDTSLAGIADLAPTAFPELHASLAKIQADINVATDHLDPTDVSKIAPTLADALKQTDALIKGVEAANLPNEAKQNVLHELQVKRVQLNDALALALGLNLEATLENNATPIGSSEIANNYKPSDVIAGSSFTVAVRLTNGALDDVYCSPDLEGPNIHRSDLPDNSYRKLNLQPGATKLHEFHVNLQHALDTRPYFNREKVGKVDVEQPYYDISTPSLRNAPQTPPPFHVDTKIIFDGAVVILSSYVNSKGPLSQPISIVEPISIGLSPHVVMVTPTTTEAIFSTQMMNPLHLPATVELVGRPSWFQNQRPPTSSALTASFTTHFSADDHKSQKFPGGASAQVRTDLKTFQETLRTVGYPGIPYTNYMIHAMSRVVPVDLNLPIRHNIAYLPGTGDAVPEALASIGLKPDILTLPDLTAAKLAQYDTVILGVRTYAAHPDLHGAPTQALLDYARNGGNVVVQYQTGEFTAADAPYPLAVGNAAERVIDETDPVQLLAPDSPLLTTLNKITPADFDNWIEERGHGFLRTWDSHYTALTETHDPGDPPQRGGLVTTPLGKGRWTYCAYALYRQLPEAVPGAFRLFVNLINP